MNTSLSWEDRHAHALQLLMCSRVHKGVEIEQNCACHQEHAVLSKERHYCTKINAAELLVLAAACGVIFGRRSAGVLFAYLTLAHCACSPPWRQAHRNIINDGQGRLFLPYITLLRRSHVCTQDRRDVLSTTPRDHSPLVRRQAG